MAAGRITASVTCADVIVGTANRSAPSSAAASPSTSAHAARKSVLTVQASRSPDAFAADARRSCETKGPTASGSADSVKSSSNWSTTRRKPKRRSGSSCESAFCSASGACRKRPVNVVRGSASWGSRSLSKSGPARVNSAWASSCRGRCRGRKTATRHDSILSRDLWRCPARTKGTRPAFTSDDLPDPLGPTRKRRRSFSR